MEKISLKILMVSVLFIGRVSFSADIQYSDTLPIGMEEAERLSFQHNLALPVTRSHLQDCGDLNGKTVVDLGSGGGDMTLVLAQMVGSSGHVYAVDLYKQQIEVAQAKVQNAGLSNVTFIEADILDPELFVKFPQLRSCADVVFTRFFMMHIKTPEQAINHIYALLKSGGKWLSEETVIDNLRSENYAPDFITVYKEFFKRFFIAGGTDADCYKKLPDGARSAGMTIRTDTIKDRLVSPDNLKQTFVNFQRGYQMAIARGLLTEEILAGWQHIVALTPESAKIYLNGLHCMTATK